jgi:signal transduction histidine kinase
MMFEQKKPRILVVDDEANNLSLFKRIFQEQFSVHCVPNAQTALDFLAQAPFDVVLLDIMMPGMTGLDLLKILRSKPEFVDLPVILVSALSETEDVVRGLKLGANDYVSKPFDIDIIIARVKTQLMLKQLQDERKQTIAELQAAHEMRDAFFKIASHDLKGPLGNIGMAEYILRGMFPDRADVNEILDMVDLTVNNMQGVIEDFLDMAAMQNGALELKLDTVSVEKVVTDLVLQYKLNAEKKDIALYIDQLQGSIQADVDRFKQAFGNFISNAIKYSPCGATITVWSEVNNGKVRLCVADQGPGIPEKERHRLFTQFGKLTTRPTAGEGSTGLGLWGAKQLITMQQGQVGVECPADGGSVFWAEMPAAV